MECLIKRCLEDGLEQLPEMIIKMSKTTDNGDGLRAGEDQTCDCGLKGRYVISTSPKVLEVYFQRLWGIEWGETELCREGQTAGQGVRLTVEIGPESPSG